ncbi:MAG TPA: SRPBCC family protein [Ramlibacter sp.]|nr:SRPBCC family protein [Ramlibacter sp.]
MIKTIAVIVVVAIGLLLVAAAFRPDTFRVARSTTIAADAGRIHPLINDLKAFNAWNPFNQRDPNIKGTYRGPAVGPGAGYDFVGNKEVGEGSVEITESTPQKITMKLDMRKPMEGHNIVEFTLVPRGAATEVTWAMHGPSSFIAKLMGMVFNMDNMIGAAFTNGLAQLKTRAEQKG